MNKPLEAPVRPVETASTWLQVRVRPSEKAAWKRAAEAEGISLSEWVTQNLNWAADLLGEG